eukprot:6214358-Pleurochrysis_carterae.AAC.2
MIRRGWACRLTLDVAFCPTACADRGRSRVRAAAAGRERAEAGAALEAVNCSSPLVAVAEPAAPQPG